MTTLFCFMLLASVQLVQAQGQFSVELTVNGGMVTQLTYPQDPNDIPTINMVMGDKLDFRVLGSTSNNSVRPKIYGLPKVWEAAFAGDMYFHVDPNFGPNTINPFIGLDSRVHTLMLRRHPDGFEVFEKDWNITQQNSSTSIYKWSYTAQREMDPVLTKYDEGTYYRWPKKHKKKDGTFMDQRQNQKEGLNMKFLYHWNNWKTSSFYGSYFGKANYMMGFDDDELAYFNHPFKETNDSHPLSSIGGVAKLETLQWKEVLEGDVVYNDMGYPISGSPLNTIVNAYRKHQFAKERANNSNTSVKYTPYYGYEIQDMGTNENNPNGGKDMPNLAHPGLVTIDYGGSKVKVKLKVRNPLRRKNSATVLVRGFYDAIIGPDAPSNSESNMGYYLGGVENQVVSEQRKYYLHYKWMNRLGIIQTKTISIYDIIQDKQRMTWTSWLNSYLPEVLSINTGSTFDLERPAYSWLTATYQRTPKSEPVIVAGKELNQIFLMFCGVKTLNGEKFPEGKGHGAYIWLEDFRSTQQGDYTEPRKFGVALTKYAKKYSKEYVFKTGDQVTFTTFDGDPHRFDNNEEEWYLSNRSIAKRVKDEVLFNAQDPSQSYLKYYIGPAGSENLTEITRGRSGKELEYSFDTPGEYDMRVVYRRGSDLLLKISVKDPIPAPALKSFPLETDSNGIIHIRSLTADEVKWLGLYGDLAEKAMVAEVKEVKTRFAFKDGFRSYRDKKDGNKLANRWSKYNDYADAYVWLTTLDDVIVPYYKLPPNEKFYNNAQTFLASYETMMDNAKHTWMWKDWANHYSSVWKGKLKKKDGLDGIPPYTSASTVTRLYNLADLDKNFGTYIDREIFATKKYTDRKKAPWQYVIPLVSTTEYYGYRQRTNPSCIYDMRKVFDRNRGAFSGNPFDPEILKPEHIQAPEIDDEIKNKQEFYYNLKYGRIAIVDKGSVNKTVRVYNVVGSNLNAVPSNAEMKFVAQKTLQFPNDNKPTGAYSANHKSVIGKVLGAGGGAIAIVGGGIAFKHFNVATKLRRFRRVGGRFRSSSSNDVESQSESVELMKKCN